MMNEKHAYYLPLLIYYVLIHTLWQYGLWSFQEEGTKLEIFLIHFTL